MQTLGTLFALIKRLKWWIFALFFAWILLTLAIEKWRTDQRHSEQLSEGPSVYVPGHQSKDPVKYKPELVTQNEWRETFNKFQWKAAHNSVERFFLLNLIIDILCYFIFIYFILFYFILFFFFFFFF